MGNRQKQWLVELTMLVYSSQGACVCVCNLMCEGGSDDLPTDRETI